jgi:hypothetical protein
MSHYARLYGLLGLPSSQRPEPEEIRKAYHKSALRLHPDKNPNDNKATARFQDVVKAYEMLMSGSVTIEEVAEEIVPQKTTSSWYGSMFATHEEAIEKKPKREAKADAWWHKNKTNAISQKKARSGMSNSRSSRFVQLAREERELRALERRIKTEECNIKAQRKRAGKQLLYLHPEKNLERMVAVYNQRASALVGAINDPNRKPLRPELNETDVEGMDMTRELPEQILVSHAEEHAAEKRDDEFLDLEMPMEFVHPADCEAIRVQRSPEQLAKEDKTMEEAQELAEKVKEFWNEHKAKEVLPPTITVRPKVERAANLVSKAAAVEYTEHHLAMLECIKFAIEAMECEQEVTNTLVLCNRSVAVYQPLSQNDNLSLADYVYADRRGKWKEDLEEITREEMIMFTREKKRTGKLRIRRTGRSKDEECWNMHSGWETESVKIGYNCVL